MFRCIVFRNFYWILTGLFLILLTADCDCSGEADHRKNNIVVADHSEADCSKVDHGEGDRSETNIGVADRAEGDCGEADRGKADQLWPEVQGRGGPNFRPVATR